LGRTERQESQSAAASQDFARTNCGDASTKKVRVKAFSLYLAFLHYQEPREINAERRLPYLKWVSREERERRQQQDPGAQFFDILHHANAFEAIAGGGPAEVTRRFGPESATIVVGNPPWGYPKKKDEDGQKGLVQTLKWCDEKKGRLLETKSFPRHSFTLHWLF
jgi:hypothetical protein